MQILLESIATVHNHRDEVSDDYWGDVVSRIELDPGRFKKEALAGLDAFSHLEVVFYMHRVVAEKIVLGARAPRNRTDLPPIGIFAQRAKNRPNQLAVSRCALLAVDGLTLHVRGLDAIDGSPVLDIKPYFHEFAPIGPVHQPAWVAEIMDRYYCSEPPDP